MSQEIGEQVEFALTSKLNQLSTLLRASTVAIVNILYSFRRLIVSHKNDNNNRMIQLTDAFCVLFRNKRNLISDYSKLLILLSANQLGGDHCILFSVKSHGQASYSPFRH